MREILFKAKRWDNKEWVEGSLITLDADSGYYFISEPYTGASTLPVRDLIYNHTHLIDAKTICQYTGLTDKNGNKIWENDIVRLDEDLYIVTWEEDDAMFALEDVGLIESFKNADSKWCEVIGNKIDNPELVYG